MAAMAQMISLNAEVDVMRRRYASSKRVKRPNGANPSSAGLTTSPEPAGAAGGRLRRRVASSVVLSGASSSSSSSWICLSIVLNYGHPSRGLSRTPFNLDS